MKILPVVLVFLQIQALAPAAVGQTVRRDTAIFIERKNEFAEEMTRKAEAFRKAETHPKKSFQLDFRHIAAPTTPGEFTSAWHSAPVSQGQTGTCWAFAATSYYESEIFRLSQRRVKLSEMFSVYWEYTEKARGFVRERGNSAFGEGSEVNAIPRLWPLYGIVPADAYTGKRAGQEVHDHRQMFKEMREYLASVKAANAWNEEQVVATIRSIMDHHMGRPPTSVTVEGRSLTPQEYLKTFLRLDMTSYVDIMSLMQKPYFSRAELEEPDNWWRSDVYCNVPLDDYMDIVKRAVRRGYTVAIGGDTSEPGYEGHAGVGVVPTFDIPPEYIDEYARQMRFLNGATTDDHAIHLVGVVEKDGKDWYLIKDSGSGSRNNSHPGYYFYREDYVKLKILNLALHKDLVPDLLEKIKTP